MKYFIYPVLWVSIFICALLFVITVAFTTISWAFEVSTDWLYETTDKIWLKYCELNSKYFN